jgi:hypothetical protein
MEGGTIMGRAHVGVLISANNEPSKREKLDRYVQRRIKDIRAGRISLDGLIPLDRLWELSCEPGQLARRVPRS